MELLFLSHCVPAARGGGDQIRAYHELTFLSERFPTHLSCFARTEQQMEDARALLDRCASVYVAPLFPFPLHWARAALRFLAGQSWNDAFYSSRRFSLDLLALIESRPVAAAVAHTAVMAPFLPPQTPFVLDLADADSGLWRARANCRKPSVLFQTEANRLAGLETQQARRAKLVLAASPLVRAALLRSAPELPCEVMESGVDFAYFDPAACPQDPSLAARRYLLFCGRLDSDANARGAAEFARAIFPGLRQRDPDLELLIAGRNPPPGVLALAALPGVEVAGTVDDVRPFYRHAQATVAPLPFARSIPNSVLESLAMNRPVLASPEVCDAFGDRLPEGVRRCGSAQDYAQPAGGGNLRRAAMARFSWKKNLAVLERALAGWGKRR